MVKEIVIETVLRKIIAAIPYNRPISEEESRELFRNIVSNMSKGEVKLHILRDLEKYFTKFEEYLELNNDKANTVETVQSNSKFNFERAVDLLGNNKSNNGIDSILQSFIMGNSTVYSALQLFHTIKLSGEISSIRPTLIDNALVCFAMELPCTRATMQEITCFLAYLYVCCEEARERLCHFLLSHHRSNSGKFTAWVYFMGYIGYWELSNSGAASNAEVGFYIDTGSGSSTGPKLTPLVHNLDHLIAVITKSILPIAHRVTLHANTRQTKWEALLEQDRSEGRYAEGSEVTYGALLVHALVFMIYLRRRPAEDGCSQLWLAMLQQEHLILTSIHREPRLWTTVQDTLSGASTDSAPAPADSGDYHRVEGCTRLSSSLGDLVTWVTVEEGWIHTSLDYMRRSVSQQQQSHLGQEEEEERGVIEDGAEDSEQREVEVEVEEEGEEGSARSVSVLEQYQASSGVPVSGTLHTHTQHGGSGGSGALSLEEEVSGYWQLQESGKTAAAAGGSVGATKPQAETVASPKDVQSTPAGEVPDNLKVRRSKRHKV